MSRNICIDIDGTMSDPYFFVSYLNKLTGKVLTNDDYISIDWNDTYGPEFQDIYQNFDDDYTYIYEEVELLDGAKEVIDELIENGDDVHFVTARSHTIDDITRNWLENQGIDSSRVYSLSGNEGKVETARKLDCDIFIEDDPNNIKNLLKAGFKVIVMDSNYNRDIIEELEEEIGEDSSEKEEIINEIKNNVKRVKNWFDIKEIMCENK